MLIIKGVDLEMTKNSECIDLILKDIDNMAPNYFREMFEYHKVPRIIIDGVSIDVDMPDKLYISDSTFREGQQAVSYLGVEKVLKIFDYIHYIDKNSGTIKYSEFFVYTSYHKKCIEKCKERGYIFPKVVGWIRSKKDDLDIVKSLGLDEVGILMSCSDYHIYKKLNMDRKKAAKEYIKMVEKAFELGIKPRVHLEDITRADIEHFVIPLVKATLWLSKQANIDVCFKLCDTLGLGVPFDFVSLPRSVPKLVHRIKSECNLLPEQLEWHGHNDFYKAHDNAVCAWLFGAGIVNTTMNGVGERTGIASFEAMIFELLQIGFENDIRIDLEALKELREYIKKEGILN